VVGIVGLTVGPGVLRAGQHHRHCPQLQKIGVRQSRETNGGKRATNTRSTIPALGQVKCTSLSYQTKLEVSQQAQSSKVRSVGLVYSKNRPSEQGYTTYLALSIKLAVSIMGV